MSYEQFIREIFRMTGIDLSFYKERQMKRRIDSLLSSGKYEGYYRYLLDLKKDRAMLDSFIEYITINVSEFFRNPEQWEYVEEHIVPILKKKERIVIWSAACSTGDEPYTIAMILAKYIPKYKVNILATDIDDKALTAAKEGIYPAKSIIHVPKEYHSYFTILPDGKYRISEEIRKWVTFKKHNLFSDEFIMNVDFLICRNVLIYFTEEVKEQIFTKFHHCMNRNGILFLGNTEQMIDYKSIGFVRQASFFYQKK